MFNHHIHKVWPPGTFLLSVSNTMFAGKNYTKNTKILSNVETYFEAKENPYIQKKFQKVESKYSQSSHNNRLYAAANSAIINRLIIISAP